MVIYLKEIDLFEKIRDVGLFLTRNGFISSVKFISAISGSLRSRVFLEQFNCVVVEIFQIEILGMRVVKRVIGKKNDKKIFHKIIFKRSYSHDVYGNHNLLGAGHIHQNVTFFEVDNVGLDLNIYEVNNNINFVKLSDFSTNINYKKKNLNEKFLKKIDFEINKSLKCKKVSDIYMLEGNVKFFKEIALYLNIMFEETEYGLFLKNLDLYKCSSKVCGVLIGNYTTTNKNALMLVESNVLKIPPINKGIFLYDEKYLIILGRNIIETMKLLMFYKRYCFDLKQTRILNANSFYSNYKEFLNEHKFNVLKSVGFKNIKIIKAVKGIKSGEKYLLKKIKEIKEC